MSGAREVIAVDGPGGSGKSTVSREVARRLGWAHLDTGAYYRAATVAVLRAGADPDDGDAVLAAIEGRSFAQEDGAMLLDGEDVSEAIRSPEVDAVVSAVSAHRSLRRRMVDLQRSWVEGHAARAVVEGRDIGSVVFPEAMVKVYLTADAGERARRRARQVESVADRIATELDRRDRLDASREASPMKAADDAVVIDTTHLGIDDVVERVLALHEAAGREASPEPR